MSNSLTGIGWRFTGINPNRCAFWAWLARLCSSWSRPIFRACPAQKTFHGWVFQTGHFGQCFENPQTEAIPILTCNTVLKQEIGVCYANACMLYTFLYATNTSNLSTFKNCSRKPATTCSHCVDADPHDFPNHM